MERKPENLTIGAYARAAGVNVETIRFYQREGLLPQPDRPAGRIRRYGASDLWRLRFVKSAQRLGFSLDEIRQLLRLEDGTHCSEAAELAALRLHDVRTRLADLKRMEKALSTLLAQCHSLSGDVCCPLIAALQSGSRPERRGSPGDAAPARSRRDPVTPPQAAATPKRSSTDRKTPGSGRKR